MKILQTLYASIGCAAIALMVAGCDSSRPDDGVGSGTETRKNGREYLSFCGQQISIDMQAAFYSQNDDGLSVRISVDRALVPSAPTVVKGFVDVLVRCSSASGGTWEKANPSEMQWGSTNETPWGLLDFRKEESAPHQAVFMPVEAYKKPDGSPFLIVCRTTEDTHSKPVRCSVDYEMKQGLHLSYTFQASDNLARWKEIDKAVRSTLTIEN